MAATLLRFVCGAAGAVAGGLAAFRLDLFRPDSPAFDCLFLGTLTAGVLALCRIRRPEQTFALITVLALVRLLGGPGLDWPAGLAVLLIGLGAGIVAWIYDLLAASGLRFGKFLVVGPLLGGIFLAVAPISELHELHVGGAVRSLMFRLFLGVLIGDSVGLGVELAELLPWATVAEPDEPDEAVSPAAEVEHVAHRDA